MDGSNTGDNAYLALVVDDDPAIGRLISMTLSCAGIRVQVAGEGREALSMAEREEPDVVILDLQMPVMDGRDFYRAFRKEGMHAPVMIVSAQGAEAAQRELGAQAYMDKPFNIGKLESEVEQLLLSPHA